MDTGGHDYIDTAGRSNAQWVTALVNLDSAALVAVVALVVPLGLKLTRLPVPEIVVEILAGIVIGAAVAELGPS